MNLIGASFFNEEKIQELAVKTKDACAVQRFLIVCAANRLLNFDNETQKKFDALLLYLKNRPEYPLLEYVIAWHRTPKYFLTDVLKAVEYILQILLKNLDNEMSYEEKINIKNYWESLVFEIWRKCK